MKVAVYCRVSTDKEDQANSFESQQWYFREYIRRQPAWELYQIYADEGITGTSTKKRTAFNRMIKDANSGCFNRIITKEVSRFSRNILDTISYTRELKRIGIGVTFMNDGIDTFEPDSELRLSIMGSIAQEESRKTSSRVKWGQTRRMEQGIVFGRSMLGYDVKDGKMIINNKGAEIVRLIFNKYVLEHKGTTVIARELREAGYRTLNDHTNWQNTVILKILRNEKYCGDLLQKKTITPDYLTHQKKYNHGEEDMIFIKDHHEPIIERDLWNTAQKEIKRRAIKGKYGTGHGNRYCLSGKIKCSKCGKSFVSRGKKRKDSSKYKTWRCSTSVSHGKLSIDPAGNTIGCDIGYQIRDEVGINAIKQSVNTLKFNYNLIASNITKIVINSICSPQGHNVMSTEDLRKHLRKLEKNKKNMLDAFFSETISKDDMKMMNQEYDDKITHLRTLIESSERQKTNVSDIKQNIYKKVIQIIKGESATDNFYGNLLEYITAYPDGKFEVNLKVLPVKWMFSLKHHTNNSISNLVDHSDCSIPISVNIALS